jgi:flagellar protein FlaG
MANDISSGNGSIKQASISYPSGNGVQQAVSSPVVAEVKQIVDPTTSSGTAYSYDSNQSISVNINTTGELKQAEVRGDKFAPGEAFIIKTIEKANKALEGRYTTLEFSVHDKTKQISIKVMDRETGEVIREIPPDKTLDIVSRLWVMAGILVDEKR